MPTIQELAHFALERTTMVTTYVVDDEGTSKPVERGSGFFLRVENDVFVVTCSHVLDRYYEARRLGRECLLQVACDAQGLGFESGGACALPIEPMRDAHGNVVYSDRGRPRPKDVRNNIDLGFIRVSKSNMDLLNQTKIAVDLAGLASAKADSGAWFRGYATGPVEYLPGSRIFACGFTLATGILEVTDSRLVLDGTIDPESIHNPDNCDPLVDLHGTSGSAVWDGSNKVVGVLWGGDQAANEIWAVPASHIEPALKSCLSKGL